MRRWLALCVLFLFLVPRPAQAQPVNPEAFTGPTIFLPSAARTADASSEWMRMVGGRGIVFAVVTSAITLTPVITISVEIWNPATSSVLTWKAFTVTITAVGNQRFGLWPDGTTTANSGLQEMFNAPVPFGASFRLFFSVADADSATYSVVGWPVP